jgi:hypothetical protein
MTTAIFNFHDSRLGLRGEFLDVLISRKVSALDLLPDVSSEQARIDGKP